jgi:5-methylcytosine-specific restriction endonuclease McrA
MERTERQLKDLYKRLENRGSSFKDYEAFKKWYYSQEKKCHYCGITEKETSEIVEKGLLTSKRFPKRGARLEISRKNPKVDYSEKNCVLTCYYCNNDKSDIFDEKQYKAFFQNRAKFLKDLLKTKK